jgi:AcrR family transcriptional regulator
VTSDDRATRDPVRTRRALIEGTARAVLAHGAGVSLDVIAREAGVSKGGLLHHFPTKDTLLVALGEFLTDRFVEAVHAELDPDDHEPGRLLRAYVRATLHEIDHGEMVREEATLMAALSSIPEVVRRAQESSRTWKEAFDADGLDPQRTAIIARAADGTAAAALFEGSLDAEEVAMMRTELLALTRGAGPLLG